MEAKKFVEKKVIIKNARLSYPALWSPKPPPAGGEGAPRYSATLILDPDNPSVAELQAAAKEVAKEKWGAKADAILAGIKERGAVCFGRGETKTNRDGEVPEELRGKVWVNVGRPEKDGPPLVVDKNPQVTVTEASGRVYAGCYVNAIVRIWPLDMPNVQRRIVAALDTIQFVRDGDAFGGGRAPTTDGLEDLSDEEGAPEMAGADDLL